MDQPVGSRRARLAALAAAAVVVGAVGLSGSSSATVTSGVRTVYVPTAPCRLMDTRSGPSNVGPRSTPLGPNETYATSARGTNGQCTIPAGAVAVAMNVTIANPTAASFLTVFPADVPRPLASSLNWIAGQAPTPNAVTSDLSADGRIAFYNNTGAVDLLADIVGYYEDHNFDDRYYTKPEVDAKVSDVGAKASHEVVVTPGLNVPDPLTPQTVYMQVNESVTTTTSGHWLVTKSFVGDLDCSTGVAFYYILVDGVPVRSSAMTRPNSGPNQYLDTLIGVTSTEIDAGQHTLGIGSQCAGGVSPSGSGVTTNSISSVTVIPS